MGAEAESAGGSLREGGAGKEDCLNLAGHGCRVGALAFPHFGDNPASDLMNGQGLGDEPLIEQPKEAAALSRGGGIGGSGHTG
jgi:hypothetical protein